LRDIVRALGISQARLERGNLRCDVNLSLMPKGDSQLGIRSETKNVNSLAAIEEAARYEIRRQAAILAAGGRVIQETRHWHEAGYTSPGRSKETAEDYRYFPEPDLLPMAPDPAWIEELRSQLPDNPSQRRRYLSQQWGFTAQEFGDILAVEGALDLVEATVAAGATPAAARKWWLGELARQANETGVSLDDLAITPAEVAETQSLVVNGLVTDRLAREILEGVLAGEGSPTEVMTTRGLAIVGDEGALAKAVTDVLAANPEVVAKIQAGKTAAAGALIGQVMNRLEGKADAAKVRQLIEEALR